MQKNTMIRIVLIFVISIVLAAFALSFRTVSEVGNHFFPGFGWLFALLIDAGMIVLGLVRLLAGIMGQKEVKRWSVAGLFLALAASFVLNIVTTDGRFTGEWLHWLVHGIPPVALLALSELALQIYDASRVTAVSPYDRLMARATAVLLKWRRCLASYRKQLAKLSQQLETAVAERDKALASHQQELAKLSRANGKLLRQLEGDYIALANLPERLAYTAVEMANGRVPNGDFVERFGTGETVTERAMTFMWPKAERPS